MVNAAEPPRLTVALAGKTSICVGLADTAVTAVAEVAFATVTVTVAVLLPCFLTETLPGLA